MLSRLDLRGQHGERGQSVVLFALLLPVVLAIGSIVLSVGNWYTHKRHLQTQVDASALASARFFQECFLYPGQGNTDIANAALQYAGDTNRYTGSLQPQPNQQVQNQPAVHVVLNSTKWWATGDPIDGSTLDNTFRVDLKGKATTDGHPCSTKFLDVKATDHHVANLFPWLTFFPSPKTKARIGIWKTAGTRGFLPLAVPENNPRTVAALFVNENDSAGTVTYAQTLTGPPVSPSMVNNDQANIWDGPAVVPVTQQTGMLVLESTQTLTPSDLQGGGKTIATDCALNGTVCYGNLKSGSSHVPSATTGLAFLGGFDQQQGGDVFDKNGANKVHWTVTVHEADLDIAPYSASGQPSGGNPCTDDTAPYYIWLQADTTQSCDVRFRVRLDFGNFDPGASNSEVRVGMTPFGSQCNGGIQLKKENEGGQIWYEQEQRWTSIAGGSGQNRFYICFDGNVSAGSGGNKKTTAVEGDFNGHTMQMAFAANTDNSLPGTVFSGPVISTAVTPSHSLGLGSQSVFIAVGLQPPLQLSGPNDPSIMLRLAGSGSLNQALKCDDSNRQLSDMIRDGCLTPYQVNTRNLQCSPNPTWDLFNLPPPLPPPDPNPWPDCIQANPGQVTEIAKGLRQRFEVKDACPPNLWNVDRSQGEQPPPTDPRYVTLVVADYGAFSKNGNTVLPITKFAGFYVTGWFIGGGTTGTQGCPSLPAAEQNDPPPKPPYCPKNSTTGCAPTAQAVQGAIWGHFVEQVFDVGQSTPGPDECDFGVLGTCVAQLVQ